MGMCLVPPLHNVLHPVLKLLFCLCFSVVVFSYQFFFFLNPSLRKRPTREDTGTPTTRNSLPDLRIWVHTRCSPDRNNRHMTQESPSARKKAAGGAGIGPGVTAEDED